MGPASQRDHPRAATLRQQPAEQQKHKPRVSPPRGSTTDR